MITAVAGQIETSDELAVSVKLARLIVAVVRDTVVVIVVATIEIST